MAANIWGVGGGSSSYFNPTSLYGGAQNMWTAPIVSGNNTDSLMNQSPQALYQRLTAPYAGGQDAFSRYVQSQYGNVNNGFKAAMMTNPDLRPDDYINSLGGRDFFQRQFNLQDARGRGLNPTGFGQGRMKWFPSV